MRNFSSYGPINSDHNYYVPRTELIDAAYNRLVGENPAQGGHYITIWAPRQTGKTWIMQQVVNRLQNAGEFDVGIVTLELAKERDDENAVLDILLGEMRGWFDLDFPTIERWQELPNLFQARYFERPVILILDEFDALIEPFVNKLASVFRSMYTARTNQFNKPSYEKTNLLHGLALIGVRSVLGIENQSGSPFNVQRSVHIPNLTEDEVNRMFTWYTEESGQAVEQEVIEQIFYETQGQPGLVSWLGELMTTTYNESLDQPIGLPEFRHTYVWASKGLPNNSVSNLISKVRAAPYDVQVMELFKTDERLKFSYDDPDTNYLYMNGVITVEKDEDELYMKFSSPFVQKRLFNFFTKKLFPSTSRLYSPFTDLSTIITDTSLDVGGVVSLYEQYVHQNRSRLFKNAPVRKIDGRIYEAVYHFNFFAYLSQFMRDYDGRVHPEFPTGNGKIDLLIQYAEQQFGLELKSFVNHRQYEKARQRAAEYAYQLQLSEIWLILFIDVVSDENRQKYEVDSVFNVGPQKQFAVTVRPRFVAVLEAF
ncbi:MAG: AAA-like domain-containing protein [Chloroflexota bacterium]